MHNIEIWGEKWSVISDDLRIDGLPWSQLDINTLRSDSKRRQHELLKMMSRQSVNTSLFTRPDGYPDYRGQILHASVEALFDALLNNNVNLFGSVFELYFRGCILLFTNLIPKGKPVDWRTQNNYKIASAALMNLMDLSGYAKLLSELSGNAEPWDIVVKTWKKHIINEPLKLGPSLLAAAIALTETPFELPHRGIIRTTWSQKINQKIGKHT